MPGDREVLVRVRATSIQPYDWHHLRGEPYIARLMLGTLGLRRPRISILGADVAGEVEAVGKDVTQFHPGDEVFAMPKQGGFAEYVCVRADDLALKPENLSSRKRRRCRWPLSPPCWRYATRGGSSRASRCS